MNLLLEQHGSGDEEEEGRRLAVRPAFKLSTTGMTYYSLEEAAASILSDARVEGASVHVEEGRAFEFRLFEEIVGRIDIRYPPLESEVRDWLLEYYDPKPHIEMEMVESLAKAVDEHFGLELFFASDRDSVRLFVGEFLRGSGVEIKGWNEFLASREKTILISDFSSVVMGSAASARGAQVEARTSELLRLMISSLHDEGEVVALLVDFTHVCEERVGELRQQACEGATKISGAAQSHNAAGS